MLKLVFAAVQNAAKKILSIYQLQITFPQFGRLVVSVTLKAKDANRTFSNLSMSTGGFGPVLEMLVCLLPILQLLTLTGAPQDSKKFHFH